MTHEFCVGTKTCRLIFPMLILAEYQLHFAWSHIAEWYIIHKYDVWPCKLMQTAFIFFPLKILLAEFGGISNQHSKLYVLRQSIDALSLRKWKTWPLVQLSVHLMSGERTFCTCFYFWSFEGPLEVLWHYTVAQSITLSQLACLLLTVHPGVMCSLCKWRPHNCPSTLSKILKLWCAVLMLMCSLLVLPGLDWGQHGSPDRSRGTQPHMQQTAMHCVF